MTKQKIFTLTTNRDQDLGLITGLSNAIVFARQFATEEKCIVFIRDHLTDKLLKTVSPSPVMHRF